MLHNAQGASEQREIKVSTRGREWSEKINKKRDTKAKLMSALRGMVLIFDSLSYSMHVIMSSLQVSFTA